MWIRDILIGTDQLLSEVFENLLELMNEEKRPIQKGMQPGELPVYYITRPEDLLLVIMNSALHPLVDSPTELEGYPHVVRVQPYNLPDLEDQRELIERFPIQLIDRLHQTVPTWKIKLLPAKEMRTA